MNEELNIYDQDQKEFKLIGSILEKSNESFNFLYKGLVNSDMSDIKAELKSLASVAKNRIQDLQNDLLKNSFLRPALESIRSQSNTPEPEPALSLKYSLSSSKIFELQKNSTDNKSYYKKFPGNINEKTVIPNDYSKVKITNQIPAATFASAMEYYFRNLTEEDISLLKNSDDYSSLLAPEPKGTHYLIKWSNEEASNFSDVPQVIRLKASIARIVQNALNPKFEIDKPIILDEINDNELISPSVRCPPLTERIISSLVDQRVVINSLADINNPSIKGPNESDEETDNVPNLEEQLKQELMYIGLLNTPETDWKEAEDDEVSAEIRKLSALLETQQKINLERKKRLLKVAEDYLGYQEFKLVIEELDKQIEQSYLKRTRNLKSKKRKSAPVRVTTSVSPNVLTLIEKRRKLLNCIGFLFPEESFVTDDRSIYDSTENPQLPFKQI
ncbi:hypothetical protein BB560_004631 [Smittium megazygosporum]|uniref:Transcriptional adapter 3 n=1 Tax=Smittium megazygosporum TaxID=133381 RepID=A0A2T9Z8P2_9FUNG|nr:hypothetical protein BB560_004631 [Smittium megazygosporum]